MADPTQRAAILRIRDLSPSVRELVLSPVERPIPFQPGQWISLKLPVGERPPLVRAYSMAEPEASTGHLVLALDRVPQGLGSGYLFTLTEQDEVLLAGPYGNFMPPDPLQKDLLLIARYTGIVPIRCILRHLFRTTPTHRVTLVYGAPSRTELIYHDEFVALSEAQASFRYLPTTWGANDDRPERDARTNEEHRTEAELVRALSAGRTDFSPMICGLKAFVRPLRAYFMELGFDRKDVRVETYD